LPALAAAIAMLLGSGITDAHEATPSARRKSAEAAAGAGAGATVAAAASVPATAAAQTKPVDESVEEKEEPSSTGSSQTPMDEAFEDKDEEVDETPDSTEQGQTPMDESFGPPTRRERIREQRKAALEATTYNIHLRSFYLDRDKFDDSQSKAWAAGGWVGLKTGYFRDRFALGATGYTSLPVYAPSDKDGTLLLQPGQDGYGVIGELYADVRITDDVHANLGRKTYDTPYINRNDTRMSPNTFEAYSVSGVHGGGEGAAEWRWGTGYFDKIKERNSDEFVSMSEDAGADVERGVYAFGGNFKKGDFSLGAVNYYSDDIINIFYTEARYAVPLSEQTRLQFAAQYTDQQSTGDDLLNGSDFSADQYGLKGELAWGPALFSVAWTSTGNETATQSPWSGYPGYTSVQVEDFNRAGEDAWMLRAAYNFQSVPGLSTYALYVNGNDPEGDTTYAKEEIDFNLQWAAPAGPLQGLALRFRYAVVDQDDPGSSSLNDMRLIFDYVPPGF
jgi:hypothetical protein